ncbi:amino acid permease/ SLC12A domain-containing protein [Flagelloscypha sp. PMI_526]|nr:amino acid permease/ SLC12A domain-containing protein [Flagelloscypha sp. PMI_526]
MSSSAEKTPIEEKSHSPVDEKSPDFAKVVDAEQQVEEIDYDRDVIDFEEKKDLKRGLKQRHIQMIALAGTIGTGLFLGSGKAIVRGGPLGAFLGYTIVGVLVTGAVTSIAEMSALVPLSGGILTFFYRRACSIWAHFNFATLGQSFAKGYNAVYSHLVSLPAEIVATAVIIEFWTTAVPSAVWITIFGLLLILSNLFFVRIYGELEFTFAMLKISLIMSLIFFGVIVSAGGGPTGEVYGFKYWKDPGLFATKFLGRTDNTGKFLGFWTTFSNAAYAYSGVETISIPAAETQAPRRNIPKAAKRIFWRVLIFYVVCIFVLTMIIPSNEPGIVTSSGHGAAASPFVIAATHVGVKSFGHYVNAIVLTSAWSAGNSGMLNCSRMLYGLAREGHAPKVLLKVNRFGIPYLCVAFFGVFLCLGYMTLSQSAGNVFSWFQDLVSVAAFINWHGSLVIVITLVYLRFYYGMKKQGISRDKLPWKGPFQPYLAWLSLISFSIILFFNGYSTFMKGHWDTEVFISSYFNIPLIVLLYIGYKYIKGTKLVSLEEMPIQKFIDIANDNPEPPERPVTGWRRFNILWS